MELNTFREWVKSVKGLKLSITTICNQAIHFLELLRDDVEAIHELVMSAALQLVVLILHLAIELLDLFKAGILLLEVLISHLILLDDVDIRGLT
jgi:hypothetical protein